MSNKLCFTIFFSEFHETVQAASSFFFQRRKHLVSYARLTTCDNASPIGWFSPVYNPEVSEFILLPFQTGSKSVTLFTSNHVDGWYTGANLLSKSTRCRSIQVDIDICDKEQICRYEIVVSGEPSRVVYTIQDPHWKFYQQGTPMPYENLNAYLRSKKKDRLTKQMIVDYLSAEGIDFTSLEGLQSRGVRFEGRLY